MKPTVPFGKESIKKEAYDDDDEVVVVVESAATAAATAHACQVSAKHLALLDTASLASRLVDVSDLSMMRDDEDDVASEALNNCAGC